MRINWDVSHTWEQWKDIHSYIEYLFVDELSELPPFPKGHLVMTTLLTEDRMNGLNRLRTSQLAQL